MQTTLLVIAAYLVGAIPVGLLIGRAHGVDIRTQGSRNIGATNVGRVVGRKWGLICLALDILKGLVPALVASLTLIRDQVESHQWLAVLLVALAAVLGHVFPVYLRFRGGKGVATTIGVALGVWPTYTIAMGAALLFYAVGRFATGMVSIGSLLLAVTFPAAVFVVLRFRGLAIDAHWPLWTIAILLGAMIIVRHRDNIQRLLRGEEGRVRQDASGG